MQKNCKPLQQVINELKELHYRYVYAITKDIKFTTTPRQHVWDSRKRYLVECTRLLMNNEVAGLSDARPIGRKLQANRERV